MKHLILLAGLFLLSCSGGECNNLPTNYDSYDEAKELVRSADFKTKEVESNFSSSFIDQIEYYSCNGETGFLIIRMRGKDYLFSNFPIDKWKAFKRSESKGKYYHAYIKGKYGFEI